MMYGLQQEPLVDQGERSGRQIKPYVKGGYRPDAFGQDFYGPMPGDAPGEPPVYDNPERGLMQQWMMKLMAEREQQRAAEEEAALLRRQQQKAAALADAERLRSEMRARISPRVQM